MEIPLEITLEVEVEVLEVLAMEETPLASRQVLAPHYMVAMEGQA